jgi:hypothetical protein
MGTISKDTESVSIYNSKEAQKYVQYIEHYPLPLDAALPIFSDVIHFRADKPVNILSKSFIHVLRNDSHFRKISGNFYTVDSSFYFHGSYFLKDDKFKIEETYPGTTLNSAQLLSAHLANTGFTVALFDLDSINIRRYKHEDFKKIFSCFY